MPDIINRAPAFGFETKMLRAKSTESKIENYRYPLENLFKILGYVPVIGTGIGIMRCVHSRDADEKLHSKTNQTIRGIIEATSLGIVLLPFDLGVTAGRKIKQLTISSKQPAE